MRLPTISELPRATACAASVVLPRYPDDGTQSPSAIRGSRIHAYIASRLRKWKRPAIGKTLVNHIQLGKLRRYLGHGEIKCEFAMAWNGASTEILGENIGRDYARPGLLCGAADILVVRPHMLVMDIKTGSRPVALPGFNWQIATLAALAFGAYPDVDDVTGVLATLNRDGSWSFDPHTWSRPELAILLSRINSERDKWIEAQEQYDSGWGVEPSPGAECFFCKCVCPHNAKKEREAA